MKPPFLTLVFTFLVSFGLAAAVAQTKPKTKPVAAPRARTVDAKAEKTSPAPAAEEPPPKEITYHNLLIRWEVISMPTPLARKMLKEPSSKGRSYAAAIALLAAQPADVRLETMILQKTKSGQRVKNEAVVLYPYGVDIDPPQIPQSYGVAIAPPTRAVSPPKPVPPVPPPTPDPIPPGNQGEPGAPGAATPANSVYMDVPKIPMPVRPFPYTSTTITSSEAKELGWSGESDLVLGEESQTVNLSGCPEFNRVQDTIYMDSAREVLQPVFTKLSMPNSQDIPVNESALIGSMEMPREGRQWLVFATPTLDVVKPAAEPLQKWQANAHVEYFSLPVATAHALARQHTDDVALYAAVEQALEEKSAQLEKYMCLAIRSGERRKGEPIDEMPYPGDFDPPQIPQNMAHGVPPDEVPRTETCPTSIELQSLGTIVELDPCVEEDGKAFSLRATVEQSKFLGWQDCNGKRPSHAPLIEIQRLTTSVTAVVQRPCLLGTLNPPPSDVLKPATAEQKAQERIWFAFLTIRE